MEKFRRDVRYFRVWANAQRLAVRGVQMTTASNFGRSCLGIGALIAACSASPRAFADEPDAEIRTTARELAREGAELANAGQCGEAIDRFKRAYALVPAPTIAVHQARCLVQLERFLEAVDLYELVQRTPLEPNPPAAFVEAIEEARSALVALRPRIPRLKVEVRGAPADDPSLTVVLNDRELPRALLGVERPIDPGQYEVTASAKGKKPATKTVVVEEGTAAAILLDLEPAGAPSKSAPQSVVFDEPIPDDPPPDSSASSGRTWGWIFVGLGAAGIGSGVATALVAQSKESALEEACDGLACPESSRDDLDSMNLFRTLSFVGYGVGIAAAATGGVLLLTSGGESQSARAELAIGIRSAYVRGWF